MSKLAEKRTNEIVGELNIGDHTDHSGHNARWCNFRSGYDQCLQDIEEFFHDRFNIHPHDSHVVQYESDTPLESIDDLVEQFKQYTEEQQ